MFQLTKVTSDLKQSREEFSSKDSSMVAVREENLVIKSELDEARSITIPALTQDKGKHSTLDFSSLS